MASGQEPFYSEALLGEDGLEEAMSSSVAYRALTLLRLNEGIDP